MRATPSTDQNPDAKEAAIVDAARRTFLVHGYDGASMDEIALAAGVSKRTVYNRFRSKEDLFAATIEESCRRILPVDIDSIEKSLSTRDFTNELAHRFLRGMLHPEALALRRIASFEAGRNPPLGRLYYDHGVAYMMAAFAPILKRAAVREGVEIADVETALHQLGALVMEPLYTEALLGVAPADIEAAIDRQVGLGLQAFWKIYLK
ncbi:MAG: TetR/AcrR family transcriptional regulator [Parvularculaceae bacterium]|nr:TetR/AcrR family transcriptional regulator [Parvularculaceae bacterium]